MSKARAARRGHGPQGRTRFAVRGAGEAPFTRRPRALRRAHERAPAKLGLARNGRDACGWLTAGRRAGCRAPRGTWRPCGARQENPRLASRRRARVGLRPPLAGQQLGAARRARGRGPRRSDRAATMVAGRQLGTLAPGHGAADRRLVDAELARDSRAGQRAQLGLPCRRNASWCSASDSPNARRVRQRSSSRPRKACARCRSAPRAAASRCPPPNAGSSRAELTPHRDARCLEHLDVVAAAGRWAEGDLGRRCHRSRAPSGRPFHDGARPQPGSDEVARCGDVADAHAQRQGDRAEPAGRQRGQVVGDDGACKGMACAPAAEGVELSQQTLAQAAAAVPGGPASRRAATTRSTRSVVSPSSPARTSTAAGRKPRDVRLPATASASPWSAAGSSRRAAPARSSVSLGSCASVSAKSSARGQPALGVSATSVARARGCSRPPARRAPRARPRAAQASARTGRAKVTRAARSPWRCRVPAGRSRGYLTPAGGSPVLLQVACQTP